MLISHKFFTWNPHSYLLLHDNIYLSCYNHSGSKTRTFLQNISIKAIADILCSLGGLFSMKYRFPGLYPQAENNRKLGRDITWNSCNFLHFLRVFKSVFSDKHPKYSRVWKVSRLSKLTQNEIVFEILTLFKIFITTVMTFPGKLMFQIPQLQI